ncbi:MAG: T9SS type A sorting domain-containing protein [Bacteroidetes bacterium]|nr:T9SS type A sorting domain-containing protein [Bacteroidota bacterium]
MRSLSRSIFFIFFIIQFISPHSANATHAFGAQLTYTNLDANRYIITYTLYRDCSGIFPASTVMINISNSCGFPPQSFSIPQVTTPLALVPVCPDDNPTTCAGGIHMGIEKYVYSDTIVLTGACANWIVSHAESSRSSSLTTISGAGSDDLYVYCLINNFGVSNNSPVFLNEPGFYLCLNRPFAIDQGLFDSEGDSLTVQMITPLRAAGSIVSYFTGYSGTQPLISNPAMSINTTNGIVSVNPTQSDFSVYALLVNEFRNGILIGQVERDLSLIARDCMNNAPDISGFDGTANYSTTILPGIQSCFVLAASDVDVGQNTIISLESSLGGLSFSHTGGNSDSATVCWTPSSNDSLSNPHCFSLRVTDSSCPYTASVVRNFCINVSLIDAIPESQQVNIQLFPNPFSDNLEVKTDLATEYDLRIHDIAGREVLKENFTGKMYELNTSTLAKGIYILSLFSKSDQMGTRVKIVKQ